MKKHIPNLLTLSNLICGALGIIQVFEGDLETATYLIWLAAGFDFLDGFVARALKVSGELGKQLDSLADMVTFGLLPAFMMFSMLRTYSDLEWLPYIAFSIAAFSALRLAKFNIDTRQSDAFIGLNTPANTLFISALPFVLTGLPTIFGIPTSTVLVAITIVFSILLVAEIGFIALKFKDFSWKNNKSKFILLAGAIVLLIVFKQAALVYIIPFYILMSVIENLLKKRLRT